MRPNNLTILLAAASTAYAVPHKSSTAGCSKPLPKGQTPGGVYNVTIPSGGDSSRYVLLSVPPRYTVGNATPAILSFHGGRRTAKRQLELDLLTSAEFNTDKFVIYPQGVDVRNLRVHPSTILQSTLAVLTLYRTSGRACRT